MSRKAMQVALEALESDPISHAGLVTVLSPGKGTGLNYARASQKTAVSPDGGTGFIDGVWNGPGPTAWQCQCGKPYTVTCISSKPSKREWVGLTDEEIQDLSYLSQKIDEGNSAWFDRLGFARAIEQALKEKNQ
jgi:hypothetical protein